MMMGEEEEKEEKAKEEEEEERRRWWCGFWYRDGWWWRWSFKCHASWKKEKNNKKKTKEKKKKKKKKLPPQRPKRDQYPWTRPRLLKESEKIRIIMDNGREREREGSAKEDGGNRILKLGTHLLRSKGEKLTQLVGCVYAYMHRLKVRMPGCEFTAMPLIWPLYLKYIHMTKYWLAVSDNRLAAVTIRGSALNLSCMLSFIFYFIFQHVGMRTSVSLCGV